MNNKTYPQYYNHLLAMIGKLRKDIPDTVGSFAALHKAAAAEGALSSKVKELMSLAIAITTHCDGCIAFHIHDALKAGATRDEIIETIGVAILMGGGPSMMYGCEALEALEQFEAKKG